MILLRLLPLIYALLFILSRRIDVKVHKADELTVKINFNIFALVLKDDKIKRKSLKWTLRILKNAKHVYKPIDYLISKADVCLSRYTPLQHETLPFSPIKSVYTYASNQLLISYLSATAKRFRLLDRENSIRDETDSTLFDIDIHLSLFHLIISALLLLYYIVKNKIKRVLKNV